MSDDLFLVLHMPKTGGTTLAANFARNFRGDRWLPVFPEGGEHETLLRDIDAEILKYKTPRTRCAFGHWVYWGIHDKIRPGAQSHYITFLRDPVERCISAYGYVKTRPQNRNYRAITDNRWSLGQWLEMGHELELSNGQLRHLLFEGEGAILLEPNLTRDHLEAAKKRLQNFWFVGLTETFDFDCYYLYGRLNFSRFFVPRVANATPNKYIASLQERAALAHANRLDTELCAFARQLHEKWKREHEVAIRLQRRRAQMMKQLYTALWNVKEARRLHGQDETL